MPTDPPKTAQSGSAAFALDGLVLKERLLGCFGAMPENYFTEYRFSSRPFPSVEVISNQPAPVSLGRVQFSASDIPRLSGLMAFLERRSKNPQPRSSSITIVRWNGREAVYDSFDEYQNRETMLPLGDLRRTVNEGSRQGLRVITMGVLTRKNAGWEEANEHAYSVLEKVAGFAEVKERFQVQIVRLQQDRHGVALMASLTPKQRGVLSTVEWHCPLSGGDGRQFLNALEPIARQAEKNAWLVNWKKARPSREVLARIRQKGSALFLVEGDREFPLKN